MRPREIIPFIPLNLIKILDSFPPKMFSSVLCQQSKISTPLCVTAAASDLIPRDEKPKFHIRARWISSEPWWQPNPTPWTLIYHSINWHARKIEFWQAPKHPSKFSDFPIVKGKLHLMQYQIKFHHKHGISYQFPLHRSSRITAAKSTAGSTNTLNWPLSCFSKQL